MNVEELSFDIPQHRFILFFRITFLKKMCYLRIPRINNTISWKKSLILEEFRSFDEREKIRIFGSNPLCSEIPVCLLKASTPDGRKWPSRVINNTHFRKNVFHMVSLKCKRSGVWRKKPSPVFEKKFWQQKFLVISLFCSIFRKDSSFSFLSLSFSFHFFLFS